MPETNVLPEKLRVTIAKEKGTIDPNVPLSLCLQSQEVQQSLQMQKRAYWTQHSWIQYLTVKKSHGVSPFKLRIKIDTGAEVTAISDQIFQSLDKDLSKIMEKQLYGPSHQLLSTLGQFEARLVHKIKSSIQSVLILLLKASRTIPRAASNNCPKFGS